MNRESIKKPLDPRLTRNYGNLSSLEQKEAYRTWAETYNQDLIDEFGYVAPEEAVRRLTKILPDRNSLILDIGCGTGLVGRLLKNEGYETIDGIDLSPEMLEKAQALGVYRSLSEEDFSVNPELSRVYRAVICVGVFSHKPDQPDLVGKLLNCLLPGGLMVATVNGKGWHEIGWETLLEESRDKYGFTIDSLTDIPYLVHQEIDGKLLVFSPGSERVSSGTS